MIDSRNKKLKHCTALTYFNALYSGWISTFDASTHVYVDRSCNLSVEFMKEKLLEVDYQIYPVPAEPLRGICLNVGTHRYNHKSIARLLLQSHKDIRKDHEVPLPDVEICWNYTQNANKSLLHHYCCVITPRLLRSLDESTSLTEHVELFHLKQQERDMLRSRDFLSSSLDTNHRTIISFALNENVWFHHDHIRCRTCTVAI